MRMTKIICTIGPASDKEEVLTQMALAGIESRVPPDQVLDAMREVGDALPHSLRETGKGGLAATPFGMQYAPKEL